MVVRANVEMGILRITVEDISLGSQEKNAGLKEGSGVGLTNVKRRLALSYGVESSLNISNHSHGSTVTLAIPAHIHSPKGIRQRCRLDHLRTPLNPNSTRSL